MGSSPGRTSIRTAYRPLRTWSVTRWKRSLAIISIYLQLPTPVRPFSQPPEKEITGEAALSGGSGDGAMGFSAATSGPVSCRSSNQIEPCCASSTSRYNANTREGSNSSTPLSPTHSALANSSHSNVTVVQSSPGISNTTSNGVAPTVTGLVCVGSSISKITSTVKPG